MNRIFLGAILLLPISLAADDAKPLPKDTQISLLKAQRQIQQLQLQLNELQKQYDLASGSIKRIQEQMENDCVAAAKEAKIDLARFTCDLDSLTFAPKVAPPPRN